MAAQPSLTGKREREKPEDTFPQLRSQKIKKNLCLLQTQQHI